MSQGLPKRRSYTEDDPGKDILKARDGEEGCVLRVLDV